MAKSPSAILTPWSSATTRSRDAAHDRHVVLDQQDRDAAVADAQDVGHQLARSRSGSCRRPARRAASSARLGRQRARDLEAPAVGVGQRVGEPVGARQQARRRRAPAAPWPRSITRAFSARADGRPRRMPARPALRPAVPADQDVLQHRHLVEQALVLEGAREPSAVMACGFSPSSSVPVVEA